MDTLHGKRNCTVGSCGSPAVTTLDRKALCLNHFLLRCYERLEGLDPTNSNAAARAIVVHSAWYVSEEMIGHFGMLGRSEGCFAVSESDLPRALDRLGPGRLLVATKL